MKKSILILFSLLLGAFLLFASNSFAQGQNTVYYEGPSGGDGGGDYNDIHYLTDPIQLHHVEVRHGTMIDAIKIVYVGKATPWHGGTGGTLDRWPEDNFHKGEYITSISGSAGNIVNQIRFHTSKGRPSPTYGGIGGIPFTYEAPKGMQIVGFFGRSGTMLDAIGVILAPVPKQ